MPDNIRFDIDRDVRIGLPEAVFCEGKSHDALLSLIKRFASDDEKPILFTRLSESVWARLPKDLRASYDYDPLSRTAWHRTCPRHDTGLASIVSAGPPSVGYGIAAGGRAALSRGLASCAPGVAVMTLDNGYGAACAAARVLTLLESVRAAR